MQGALKAASNGDAGAAAEVNSQLGAMGSRMEKVEGSVGGFTTKLTKELSTVVTSNADMKAALEELQAKTDRTAKSMADVAAELAEVRARAGGAPPGPPGPAALERDAVVTIVQDAVRPEMAALTKRVKVVESSVKSFSEKLGSDVEVWQAAVNAELQAALTKVKEQLKLHETDVDAIRKAVEEGRGKGGEGGAASGGGVDGDAVNKRLKVVEASVKSFSEKLGADVEAWQKAMNSELQGAIAKVKEQMRVNHEQVTKMADDVAAMRSAANLGGGATSAAGDVAALGKRLKAVEESVKTFSSKLGTDVEAWQQAINTELQSALGKVKEQVFKNADAVQKVTRDVEALTGDKPAGADGGKAPPDAAAQTALQKRVKVLEATLAAHEMALQAHTETLEAHATWLE
jgi:archaellum component FlaC